jgi:type IX secretion system PorP/SprF family membrane protein
MELFSEVKAGVTRQWLGFDGAPAAMHVSVASRALSASEADRSLGIGGIVFSEQSGPSSVAGAGFRTAYHIPLVGAFKMGLGTGVDMIQVRFDPTKVVLDNPADLAFYGNGPNQVWIPSLDAGALVYSEKLYLSTSVRQAIGSRFRLNPVHPVVYSLRPIFHLQAGGRIPLSTEFEGVGSIGLQSIGAAFWGIDWGVGIQYKRKLTASVRWRPGDACVGTLGFGISRFLQIDYAYEVPLSKIRQSASGSHVLMVSVRLGKEKGTTKNYFW